MSTLISRIYNWVTDKANNVKITASRVDAEMDQVVTALNRKVLCSASQPSSPIAGQTWVDTTNNLVKCYLGGAWVIIANFIYIQSATPTGTEGYFWWDTTNDTFNVYDGSNWLDVPAIGSTAAGDIMYHNGTKWVRLAKGSAGEILTQNSGEDAPEWAAPVGIGHYDGTQVFSDSAPTSWTDLDLSSYVGSNSCVVWLKAACSGADLNVTFRTNGESAGVGIDSNTYYGAGISGASILNGRVAYIQVITDTSGIVEWKAIAGTTTVLTLIGYLPLT